LGLKQRYAHLFSARFSEGEWDRPLLGSLTLWPIITDEWDGLVKELLTLELDFQVNVCLFTWSSALYMVAVDFPSGGQDCNNIITNNSKLIELIQLIKLFKSLVCLQYQRVRFNKNQVMMQ
jgi:hypothetical protein